MRITTQMSIDRAIRHMNENLERISVFRERVASGKQLQSAADDPALAVAGLSLRSTLQAHRAYMETAGTAVGWMDANELALKDMVEIGARALDLARQGASDTLGDTQRNALALEVDALLQQAADVGNSQHQGKYLFAGFQTTTQPYTYAPAGVASNLASTAGVMQQAVAPGHRLTVNVDGNAAFTPLFSALRDVRDALQTPGNIPGIQTALAGVETATQAVADLRTANGARVREARVEQDRMARTEVALKKLLSDKEDADMAESISLLQRQETIYQTVLRASQSTVSPNSLFDFLR